MSLNAAAIAAMVERGLSAADILAVAEALEVKKDRTGAERQARYRERKAVTRDVTRDEPPCLDKEKSPEPPKEINPIPATQGVRVRAKHPLPANWAAAPLKPDGEAGRIVAAWQPGRIERELSKFKDHALQNRRLCSCWDAAWRNWIKRTADFERQSNERPSNPTAIALQRLTGAFGH